MSSGPASRGVNHGDERKAASKVNDGREVRRHNNERRIVAAMLELVRGGAISPRAEDVAARAGVSLRTVFRHFADMDTLYRQMADAMQGEIRPILAAAFTSPEGRPRLLEMIDRRSRAFEKLMPFKNAADVHRHRSAFLREDYANLRELERAGLQSALPARLKADRTRIEALDLLLSFDAWQRLRQEQKLCMEQAKEVVTLGATAVIGDQAK